MPIVDILNHLKEYGVSLVLIAIVLFFAYSFGQVALKYFQEKLKPKTPTDPRNHVFFSNSATMIDYHIPRMRVSDDAGRNVMFREMIVVKIKIWRNRMLDLTGKNLVDLKTFEFKEVYMKAFRALVSEYEAEWSSMGVPEVVISKFNSWHSLRIEAVQESSLSIFDGRSFTTPNEMLNAILCLQNALLIETILDAEHTLGELNGELTGKKYRDLILG